MPTESFAYSKRIFHCDQFLFKTRNRIFLLDNIKDLHIIFKFNILGS